MKKLYKQIAFLILFSIAFLNSNSQIKWVKTSGTTGAGSFTISGGGSVSTLNSGADIAFLKHGSGSNIYYTCNTCTINLQITGQLTVDYPVYLQNSRIVIGRNGFN